MNKTNEPAPVLGGGPLAYASLSFERDIVNANRIHSVINVALAATVPGDFLSRCVNTSRRRGMPTSLRQVISPLQEPRALL